MRMCYTFRRSSRAMAVTSTTTMAAFCANYFSPLMPIKSFGIFAGIIVPINYILVVMFYPSFIFIHESEGFQKISNKLKRLNCLKKDAKAAIQTEESATKKVQEISPTERFFKITWNMGVLKFKWIILVFAIGWSVFAAIKASEIKPLTEPEEMVDINHPS